MTKLEESSTMINAGQPGSNEVQDILSDASKVHVNVTKMWNAFHAVIDDPEFYESDSKVKKFLEASKAPDPSQKYWKSSMTNARKELNDKAMEEAKRDGVAVVIPTEEAIESLAIVKFKDTWIKFGKGKPLPSLPLKS